MIDAAFGSFPVLETESLLLRRITAADAKALYAILSNEEVTRYYDDDPFRSIASAEDQIEAWENGYGRRAVVRWGIVRKADGRLAGTCGMYGFHSLHLRASVGYELDPSYWRRGVMTEALGRVVEYGFGELGLRRLQAFVMPDNTGSVRLLRKLGFKSEGTLREYETWGSKGFVDLSCYSLIRREWRSSTARSSTSIPTETGK